MPEIIITVSNKAAQASVRSIVCDNTDYTLRFVFDSQWGEGAKTVFFILQGVGALAPAVMTSDTCALPAVHLNDGVSRQLAVGVQQGTVKTTTAAYLWCYPSAENELLNSIVDDDGVTMTWLEWVNANMAAASTDVQTAQAALAAAREAAAEAAGAAQTAETKAGEAASSATAAAESAETASEAASTATTKAGEAEASADSASGSASTASAAAQAATTKASEAAASAESASGSATTASTAAQTATTKASEAASSAESVAGSASTASTAAQTATTKASEAAASAESASGSASTASAAAQTAETKAGEAAASAESASESAETASEAASTATTKAGEAAASADSVSGSVSAASEAAQTATAKATEAATSAESASGSASTASAAAQTAETKAGEAAASATAAAGSATTASGAASTATTKAGEAASSAAAAAGSATTASGAASTATTKAGEAAASAESASGSASTASTAAQTAETKAGEAAASATAAAGSATTASGAASTATTKAGEAAASAESASGSASTASTAAQTATTKASEAAESATAAIEAAVEAMPAVVTTWLEEHISPADPPVVIDTSLEVTGAAADAKAAGDKITNLTNTIENGWVLSDFTPTMTKGSYYAVSSGIAGSSTKYARSTYLLTGYPARAAYLLNSQTYEFCASFYDATGTTTGTGFIASSGYQLGGKIYIPKTAVKVGLSFRRQDQAVLVDDDVSAIVAALSVYTYTDTSFTGEGKASDAKATGDEIKKIRDSTDTYLYGPYDYGDLVHDDGIPISSPPNGHITSNAKYCRTGFITLKASALFKISLNNDTYQWRIVSYKQSAFLSSSTNTYKSEYTGGAYEAATKTYYASSHSNDECYLVVSFRRADQSNLSDSDYTAISASFKLEAMICDVPQCFQSVQNSPAAVYHMMETAETYLGRDDMWYGNANVAYSARVAKCAHGEAAESADGKFNIDCSTFATLCLRGTPFGKSRYVTWDSSGETGNGTNTETGGYIFDEDSNWYSYRTYGGGEMLANQMANYAYTHGYLYKIRHRTLSGVNVEPVLPDIMCHDVRPGDLIFLSNAGQKNYYWMDIGHVMVVADIDDDYIYFYEAVDASADGEYYSPAFRRRARSYLDGNDVYFGARFPLAERGTMPRFCNIVPVIVDDIVSAIPDGVSPAPVLTSPENGALQIAGSYNDPENPIEYRIPFTAPGDAVCSFGIKETDAEGILVGVWEEEDDDPVRKAFSPDKFSDSDSDARGGKCWLEGGKSYYIVISLTQLSDSITVHPYVIKGVTFDGYKPYIGGKYELEENIADLIVT